MIVAGGPQDPAACALIAGDLEAVFLPAQGMLGASVRSPAQLDYWTVAAPTPTEGAAAA